MDGRYCIHSTETYGINTHGQGQRAVERDTDGCERLPVCRLPPPTTPSPLLHPHPTLQPCQSQREMSLMPPPKSQLDAKVLRLVGRVVSWDSCRVSISLSSPLLIHDARPAGNSAAAAAADPAAGLHAGVRTSPSTSLPPPACHQLIYIDAPYRLKSIFSPPKQLFTVLIDVVNLYSEAACIRATTGETGTTPSCCPPSRS